MLVLVAAEPLYANVFVSYKEMIHPHSRAFYIMNLVITLCTVVIVSFLYAQEINQMNQEIDAINAELDYKASHDQLTGLLNRHEMNHYIDEIMNIHPKKFMVVMMDVDDFKIFNDTYGHDAGDLVLKEIAQLIKQYLGTFKVARWGGEEFLVIGEIEDEKAGLNQVNRFHQAVNEHTVCYNDHKLDIFVTVGFVVGDDVSRINHLVLEADNLLYIGKRGGKNCVLTYQNVEEYKNKVN